MATTTWAFDPAHSELQFKVKHLLISTVTGSFQEFNGSVSTEEDDFDNARINFETSIDSLTTHNEQRDGHLKSADFFEIEKYPKLSFNSTKFQKKGDNYELHGDLTIKGITHPVTLSVDYNGIAQDPYGNTRAGFELNGKINRKDFGLTWNALTEAGGMVVGEEVKLHGNIQLIRQ